VATADPHMIRSLKTNALKAELKTANKTKIVGLLRQDGRATGAVGINLLDGHLTVISAKATM
jgi:succinate dehydrogenase/fumarate reductase flavoprotein subunit